MPLRLPSRKGAQIISPQGTIFTFDATLSENYGSSVEWTPFPVEGGDPEIVDHANIDPDTISLTGVVSDTPLSQRNIAPDRAATERQKLVDMAKARLPVVVITGIGVFSSMALTSVSTPRVPADGASLTISIELRQIITVQSVEVAIPPELLKPKVENAAQTTGDAGTQAPVDVGLEDEASDIVGLTIPPERDVTKSLLASGVDLAAEFDFRGAAP